MDLRGLNGLKEIIEMNIIEIKIITVIRAIRFHAMENVNSTFVSGLVWDEKWDEKRMIRGMFTINTFLEGMINSLGINEEIYTNKISKPPRKAKIKM